MDENGESLVFVTIWDCRTHVPMTSMTSSVERTDLDFKISVALVTVTCTHSVSIVQFLRDFKASNKIKKKQKKNKANGKADVIYVNIYSLKMSLINLLQKL